MFANKVTLLVSACSQVGTFYSYKKGASKIDWLAIVSLIVGIFSIVLAIYSMVSTAKMQKRIVKICKNIRKLIDGKEDKN